MKVLCIGSAVMDIMGYPIDRNIEWKEKQRVDEIRILPGGDAVNQSIYMAMLGAEPAIVTCVGQDTNGKILKSALKDMGVETCFVKEKTECATGTAIVLVGESGVRRVFSVKGAHSTLSAEDVPEVGELPESIAAVSLASLFSMPEFEKNGLLEYLVAAKERGMLVFADLAADKLGLGLSGIREFLPYIDYFLPSLYDILSMTGTETAEDAAKVFHELGTEHVVIKCGEKGCYCSAGTGGFKGWIPAVPVTPVDTTGAGDCMVAVFITRILAGDSMAEACRYACAAASYSTLFSGASTAELSDDRIFRFMQDNQFYTKRMNIYTKIVDKRE